MKPQKIVITTLRITNAPMPHGTPISVVKLPELLLMFAKALDSRKLKVVSETGSVVVSLAKLC